MNIGEDSTLEDNSFHSFASSKWLSHVASLMRGAVSVADSLHHGYPMLVHCSDGWDRTSQLTAFAQLLLDPFYRTISGFLMLIHKEFVSFGHKFEDRMGHGHSHKEMAPIFMQFLDCVYQCLHQFPCDFEFTSYFLDLLVQAVNSGHFISFRMNHEQERMLLLLQQQKLQQEAKKYNKQAPSSSASSASTILRHSEGSSHDAAESLSAPPPATAPKKPVASYLAAEDDALLAQEVRNQGHVLRESISSATSTNTNTNAGAASSSPSPLVTVFEPELWQCASFSFYVQFLLRCPAQAQLLRNPQYQPRRLAAPFATYHQGAASASYLRPMSQNVQLVVWKEGIFGLNANMLGCWGGWNDVHVQALEAQLTVADRLQT